ncbi:MAG: 16S rRNA (uracil(1498)-N(3))-methyltransferase [Bacilli bacterium]|nr:16S rRNA (uracil(1498)-N(3))-methyltransferase [Bacilli bacterium]
MQRYFASKINDHVILGDDDVHHLLHVMRIKKGEEIEVVIDNTLYNALIKETNPLDIKINYQIPSDSEIKEEVTLFFALAKGDKIDFVIQKATELGVSRIILFKSSRCVVKYDDRDLEKKLTRFKKIAKEASEQCHRLKIPEIIGVVDINKIDPSLLSDINLVAYEKVAGSTNNFISSVKQGKSISMMIGPEGGFSNEEIMSLVAHNFSCVSLGKRILRTETAAVYALSVIASILEN